jgi:hypothetical protein
MDKNSEEKIPEEVTTEEISSALKRAEVYISRSIYVSNHLLEYHPADAAVLFSHAKQLNITMPPHLRERIEEFLVGEFSSDYERLPFKNIITGFSYLLLTGYDLEKLSTIVEYIFSFQNENGGLGSYKGDVGRIPNTGEFLSSILSRKYENEAVFKTFKDNILKACNFVICEWEKDFSSHIALSHKGAYVVGTLLKGVDMEVRIPHLCDTIRSAVEALLDMQLDNGSWTFLPKMSMKRVKLASSAPNITALVICSLCDAYLKEKSMNPPLLGEELSEKVLNSIKKGCKYISSSQTPYGFWYAHSIAESSFITGECALALKKSLEVLRDGQ